MIIIEKAILHILDFHSGVTVYSDAELPVKDSVETPSLAPSFRTAPS